MPETCNEKMNGGQKWMKEKIKGGKFTWFCVKSIGFDTYLKIYHGQWKNALHYAMNNISKVF